MSATLELRAVDVGSDDYVDLAWELKEEIRRREGVLKQRRRFFYQAYRRARCHLLFNGEDGLVGFASTRSDGYLLFLAVHPHHRGQGHGRRLIAAVAQEHDAISCHARSTNEDAIGFYRHLGFEIDHHITNYYEDRGDAYLLRLGDPGSLADRLRDYLSSR